MFGIAKPCRHHLSPELYKEWVGHQCGLCLTLREHHGQGARLTTNTDAIVLSVLTSAQRFQGVDTVLAAPCPLRGMRAATVVAPGDPAAVHAAAVSLTMAATKVADHALDREGVAGRLPRLANGVSHRWSVQGDDLADLVAFDTSAVRDAIATSNERERRCDLTFDLYVAPTEEAAAAACRHTAIIADRPQNLEPLGTVGAMFGRITYLLDALDDQADDIAAGRFNALVTCFPDPAARLGAARTLFDDAHARLVEAFDRLELAQSGLARALLVDQLARAGRTRLRRAAAAAHGHVAHEPSCPTRTSPAPTRATVRDTGRVLVGMGVAAAGALTVGLSIFRPEDGAPGEPPFDPNQIPPGPYPPGQYPPGPQPPPQQSWGEGVAETGFENAADAATDAACFCCDCDCCCDCGDCCDC